MRKHPPYDGNFKTAPLQAAIMEAAEKGVDWEHVQALIKTLAEAGKIDAASQWDKQGRSLVGALMGAHRSSYDSAVPIDILDMVLALDPGALARKDKGGNTPVDMLLDSIAQGGDKVSSNLRGTIAWWLTHADKQQLLQWVPRDRHGDSERAEPNGYHLVNAVLHAEYDTERQIDTTLLDTLAGLGIGIDFNARNKDKNLAVSWMMHASQWDSFIANGGDPYLLMGKEEGEKVQRPLWRWLVETKHTSISKAAADWALENAGEEMKQKAYNDYWEALRGKTGYGPSPSDMPGYLRDHPDYLTLRDPQGRTPTMYGIQMHASSHRVLRQKQYAEMNKQRDNNGYTLWHYALSQGKKFTGEMGSFLLESGAPRDPNPKTGRGWIVDVMTDFKTMASEWDAFPREIDAVKRLAKKTTGEQWWAMQPKDIPVVRAKMLKILETSGTNSPDKALGYLACEFIDHIPDETLRNAVMEFNLNQYSGANANGVRKYIELGHADAWNEQKIDGMRGKFTTEEFAQIKSEFEARQMQLASPDAGQPARRGPRL